MRRVWWAAAVAVLATATGGAAPESGYLDRTFDWRTVLAPPPVPRSPAGQADRAAFDARTGPPGSPAWRAAISQLYPGRPEVTAQFACAAGHVLSTAQTPATVRMLRRLGADMSPPIENAKLRFRRDRPYVGHPEIKVCDPRSTDTERTTLSYSYPSGHATFGALWARALADADPADAARIIAFGRSVGDNRIACGVHYPSDVAAGQRLADAIYEKIAATPAFQADLAAARAELAKAPSPTGCHPT